MSSRDAAINQKNINKYFKGWIGISVSPSQNPSKKPPTLFLEFSSKCHATSAFLFLGQWQNYLSEQSLRFSVIEEKDGQLTCYFYTPNSSFTKKGKFRDNFNLKKIKQFIEDQQQQQNFRVATRYADANYDVNEVEDKEVSVWLHTISYKKRNRVTEGQIEFE